MRAMLTPAILAVSLFGVGLLAQAQQQRRAPSEQEALQAAKQIENLGSRAKELQRIRAAHPNSSIVVMIDLALLEAVSLNADTLEDVLAAQGDVLRACQPQDKVRLLEAATGMIMAKHPKAADFPKADVLKAVQGYRSEALSALDDPKVSGRMPEAIHKSMKNAFDMPLAKAQIGSGEYMAALRTLREIKATQELDPNYYFVTGEALSGLDRDKEALESYLMAAVEGHQPSLEKARALYAEINGSAADFDADLIRRRTALPFHPPPFKAPEDWKGKAVLAELFTGSECPPCVAADFAFDALIETYPATHLAVLVYHLPIPRYDPMMNPATQKRQEYYGRSTMGTPTVIIDGANRVKDVGGYYRYENPLESFNLIKPAIDSLMGAPADVAIKADASLNGDKVQVKCEFSKVIPHADYNVVLVQGEEIYQGLNLVVSHKMVVRDIATVSPAAKATVVFDIAKGEKDTSKYIAEWGKTRDAASRLRSTSWPSQNNKVNRDNLKAVVFVQDKNTKRVYNSFAVDVKK